MARKSSTESNGINNKTKTSRAAKNGKSLDKLPKEKQEKRLSSTTHIPVVKKHAKKQITPKSLPIEQELNQRNSELQIINSIQQGLAAELDFQAIVDLVGDKLREVFDTPDLAINWHEEKTNLIHYLYNYEHGERLTITSRPPTPGGIFERMVKNRQPVVWNTIKEGNAISPVLPGTDDSKSGVSVPIISSDRVLGSLQLENYERENAYGESELRLLTTIAASLGTALENARLFDETQQRNAELAIINSVQEGLAAKMDIQSIYDLIGDKIRNIFNAQAILLVSLDADKQTSFINYGWEKGQRFYDEASFIHQSAASQFEIGLIQTPQVILINDNAQRRSAELGLNVVPGTKYPKSMLFVPMIVGNNLKGYISLQNVDTENAFSESDVRLLQTLANSMSVALENARLFDETQRLLKITEDRAAELAIINSVQEGLASKLEMEAIYDLVGNQIQEIFDAQIVIIGVQDRDGIAHFPFAIDHGQRVQLDPIGLEPIGEYLMNFRQPLLVNMERDGEKYGQPKGVKSFLAVPMFVGEEFRGAISLQNADRENAFSDSDVRLLSTLSSSMSVALENARLFDETQRLLKITEDRAAELAVINSIQQGLAAELDFQTIIDLVGDKLREVLNTGEIGIRWHEPKTNLIHYLYEYEHNARITIPSAPPQGQTWEIIARDSQAAHLEQYS